MRYAPRAAPAPQSPWLGGGGLVVVENTTTRTHTATSTLPSCHFGAKCSIIIIHIHVSACTTTPTHTAKARLPGRRFGAKGNIIIDHAYVRLVLLLLHTITQPLLLMFTNNTRATPPPQAPIPPPPPTTTTFATAIFCVGGVGAAGEQSCSACGKMLEHVYYLCTCSPKSAGKVAAGACL